jgi:cell division protein FtsI (penicillin-binding protein 3)
MRYSTLLKKLRKKSHFVWLKREVSMRDAKAIEALGLRGIYSRKESKRVYPHKDLARSVIGIAGRDGTGLEGIEKVYDRYLQSADKTSQMGVRDALGKLLLFKDYEKQWFEGNEVKLSLDLRLQQIVESELRASLKKNKAQSAQAVMLDPSTGAILAMASVEGNRKDVNSLRNRPLSDVYEPGSTFKVILAAAGIEHLGLTASSQIFGENGSLKVGRHTIREYNNKKHQWLSLQELLEVSSNVASAKLGLRIGADKFDESIRRFGFGSKTKVDLPGEAVGLLRPSSKWKPIELANISFGQGVAVTPLQMATAFAAIANGGYKVKPHFVSQVSMKVASEKEKKILYQAEEFKEEILSPKIARTLTEMLSHVTEPESTGAGAAIKGYKVAGKTGTSQKLVEKTNSKGKKYKAYSRKESFVSFAGFVPAHDPAFVLLVLYDNPQGDRTSGGRNAAPSFKRIARRSLAVLGIPPQKHAKMAAKKEIVQPGKKYVGRSFQDVLREIRALPEEQRAQIDLIGFGTAVKEEATEDNRIKVFFE